MVSEHDNTLSSLPAVVNDSVLVKIDLVGNPRHVYVAGLSSWNIRDSIVTDVVTELPAEIVWYSASLFGAAHTMTLRGHIPGTDEKFVLDVGGVAAGYRGSGSIDAATILGHLGFGPEGQDLTARIDAILTRISTPQVHLRSENAWRSRYFITKKW